MVSTGRSAAIPGELEVKVCVVIPRSRRTPTVSLWPRESGMVNTGRSAATSGELEVKVCAVIPRSRRTPVDVRRWHSWSADVENSGVDGPEVEAKEPGREWMPQLAAIVVSTTRLARSAENSTTAGMARCRAPTGDEEASVVEGLGVPTNSCPHLKSTA